MASHAAPEFAASNAAGTMVRGTVRFAAHNQQILPHRNAALIGRDAVGISIRT
jgi:hypothetical protein